MGKLTISMAIFNSYVKLPEGKLYLFLGILNLSIPTFGSMDGMAVTPLFGRSNKISHRSVWSI